MERSNFPTIAAVAAGILWGTVGVYIRFLSDIPVIPMIGIRFLLAGAILVAIAALFGRINELGIARKDYFPIAVFSAINGLSTILFTEGVLRVPLGNALFLFYTAPFFTIILARIFSGEEVTRGKIYSLALALAGAFLLFAPGTGGSLYGNLLCIGAAVLYSIYTIQSRGLRKYPSLARTVWPFLIPGIFLIIASVFQGSLKSPSPGEWGIFVLFSLTISLTFFLFNWALKYLSAGRTSILLLSEPLAAAILGFLFFSEKPSGLAPIGFALISGAILVDAFIVSDGKTQK